MGITVPISIEQAYKLDEENKNTLWQDAIAKEMRHVLPAFSDPGISIDEVKKRLIGYQRKRCHIIIDIKMDFARKARFVAGGHVTDPPDCMMYSSVVSRETVRITFLLAALNDLDVCAANIGNAYLNADCAEHIYTMAGKEFGKALQGKVLIVCFVWYRWRHTYGHTYSTREEFYSWLSDYSIHMTLRVSVVICTLNTCKTCSIVWI